MRKLIVFDTTLRDGEQAPGFSMSPSEKIKLALQLERLGVDVIEAGFPVSSPGDFESVKGVASVIKNTTVAGLCRANKKDIDAARDALKDAVRPRIHTFIATSPIHMKYKLKMEPLSVLDKAKSMVAYARNFCDDVEFSPEDGMRTDMDFLCKVIEEVITAGASTVNIPDTVGYRTPWEIETFISTIMNRVPNIDKAVVSIHCHNDLGLAVSNSLAAVKAGASQVECSVNGIGERAGNASLEEIVMSVVTRKDFFNDIEISINTSEIYRTSKLLTSITGVDVQPNKAIIGKNAFAHEAGIHQDGVLKEPTTYEIMTPESIGVPSNSLVLGKHSGRHAFVDRMSNLGLGLTEADLERAFEEFKVLADKKKEIFDEDLETIAFGLDRHMEDFYSLQNVQVLSGNRAMPTATVSLKDSDGNVTLDASIGDGPVDASFKAVERIAGVSGKLITYKIDAVTSGKDAQGGVNISVDFESSGKIVRGSGYDTDIIVASVKAYVNALNRYLTRKQQGDGEKGLSSI